MDVEAHEVDIPFASWLQLFVFVPWVIACDIRTALNKFCSNRFSGSLIEFLYEKVYLSFNRATIVATTEIIC